MKPVKEVVALVVDTGLFVHIARRLGRDLSKVYYWTPWETSFPKFKDAVIGDGYPEIQRIESIEQVKDECDLFVFPDIGYADLQEQLVKEGKAVWGCRHADELEARRGKFLHTLAMDTKLPVPKYEKVVGLEALRKFLAENPDRYIKVSTYRGDFETCHFRSMEEDSTLLDSWGVKLGPLREQFIFYVFEPIDSELEDGIDTWCIDGRWPETVIHGQEMKDSSYIGAFQKLSDVAPETRIVCEEFGPVLARYGYRSAFSCEVRITKDGESFFIDPTCRFPSPPSQVMCEMVGNLGEIIWHGANGILVEPVQNARYGVQAIFKVDRDEWGVFKITEAIADNVKIGFSCMVGGAVCVPPDPQGVSEIGWICATGDSVQEAAENLKAVKDQMPYGCHIEMEGIASLVRQLEESGVEISEDPLPEPAAISEAVA